MATYDLFFLLVALSHLTHSLGFFQLDYFFSFGYALAMLVLALVGYVVGGKSVSPYFVLYLCGIGIYGLRLAYHVAKRDFFLASFRETKKELIAQGKKAPLFVRIAIWMVCAWLSPLMVSPLLFLRDQTPTHGTAVGGLVAMFAGLIIETLADRQKAQYKILHGNTFCDDGLYRLSRHPNYAGELLFWVGAWVTGISCYVGVGAWLLTLGGLAGIVGVMLHMTRHTENLQIKRYGSDPRFVKYAKRVPILIPLLPIYTFNPKVIPGLNPVVD